MSFVLCLLALNLCCKTPSFSPPGQEISAGERRRVRAVCTPRTDSLSGPEAHLRRTEVASARSKRKRVRIHGKPCSPSSAGPAVGGVHPTEGLSGGISSYMSVGQTHFSSRTFFCSHSESCVCWGGGRILGGRLAEGGGELLFG